MQSRRNAGSTYRDVRQSPIDRTGHLKAFLSRGNLRVNGVVEGPGGGAWVNKLEAEEVLVLGERATFGHPE